MIWQRRSRTLGPAPFPLPLPFVFCGANFSPVFGIVPISSTEQIPMPYALRRARLTARVSATRISAPRTSVETLDGSASPYPTKPREPLDGKTVALRTNRFAPASHIESTASTWMPLHLLRRANPIRPVCVTYQQLSMNCNSPLLNEKLNSSESVLSDL